ncbi:hypothetical protein ASPWEDRAFT_747424 [Aspergillus wentii DTO 134E9]|uniref:Uncharacterized protein n=1 Tax=Aspergillus wentii DTO 134E9 TaxID=1073089 RepID=A0A1L9R937_ASPWE|nr:uncharacterized protein ASPWEDRAFT_747424 [Aspergillus wentii DTO 134E9]OJJ31441.1 hypothetical protein ASPWEDRAFT_747424 [Aspergillus wentii DTO 134E9]
MSSLLASLSYTSSLLHMPIIPNHLRVALLNYKWSSTGGPDFVVEQCILWFRDISSEFASMMATVLSLICQKKRMHVLLDIARHVGNYILSSLEMVKDIAIPVSSSEIHEAKQQRTNIQRQSKFRFWSHQSSQTIFQRSQSLGIVFSRCLRVVAALLQMVNATQSQQRPKNRSDCWAIGTRTCRKRFESCGRVEMARAVRCRKSEYRNCDSGRLITADSVLAGEVGIDSVDAWGESPATPLRPSFEEQIRKLQLQLSQIGFFQIASFSPALQAMQPGLAPSMGEPRLEIGPTRIEKE